MCCRYPPRIDEYGLGSAEALMGPNAIIMAAGLSSKFAPLQFEVSRRSGASGRPSAPAPKRARGVLPPKALAAPND